MKDIMVPLLSSLHNKVKQRCNMIFTSMLAGFGDFISLQPILTAKSLFIAI